MDEREFFDRLAPTWDEHERLSVAERVWPLLRQVGFMPGQSVLDLGTGTGVLIPYISQLIGPSGSITAVDFSTGMLSRARMKWADLRIRLRFLLADFEQTPVPGVYDRIMLYCVYPHLHNPLSTLERLRSCNLAPGGTITIAFPCGPDFINRVHRRRHSDGDVLPSADDLATTLRRSGFDASVTSSTDRAYIITVTSRRLTSQYSPASRPWKGQRTATALHLA